MNSDQPVEPPLMSRRTTIAYAIGYPLGLGALLFLPAGSFGWAGGWVFLLVMLAATVVSLLVVWRVNPVIFRARSRIQPGTKSWDRTLLAFLLPMIIAILPIAGLDTGRWRRFPLPLWLIVLGYLLLLAGFAVATHAEAVNRFFEPGVRIQTERHHHVIDTGPYAVVRHPGYVGALLLGFGAALSLGSLWALIPAFAAAALVVLRTVWEDRTLQSELPGYCDYARRVRWKLLPGVW